jgi:hypothetical protein
MKESEAKNSYKIGIKLPDEPSPRVRGSLGVPAPQKTVWQLTDMKGLADKLDTNMSKMQEMCISYAQKATYFVNNDLEWKEIEKDFFGEFDINYQEMKSIYQLIRKNMGYVFTNVVNGVNLGLNQEGFSTKSPKNTENKAANQPDEFRNKYFKRSESVEDVTDFLLNLKLIETNEELKADTSSIYHIERVSEEKLVITGCWGYVGAYDLKTDKMKNLNHQELSDFGNDLLTKKSTTTKSSKTAKSTSLTRATRS